jgi:predicted negative regulator of RcsB-dependent stress response
MDDYLSEREQAETLKRWFRDNWLWLVVAVALGLGIVYGRELWGDWRTRDSLEAAALYEQMAAALEKNERPLAFKLAGQIAADHARTPYADQAELLAARAHVEVGELDQAAKRLAKLATGARDEHLRVIAGVRLARVQLAQGQYDAALKTLDAASVPAVDARIAEVRGDVLLAKGDRTGALRAYEAALAAARAKPDLQLVDSGLLELKIDDLADARPVK